MVFGLLHAFWILCAFRIICFIILNMLWHVLLIRAVWVPWVNETILKTETENHFYNIRLPWKRDMGWFGSGLYSCLSTSTLSEGRAFGSWHAPPLKCGLLWSCFSTSISGGSVGRCFHPSRCWCCEGGVLFIRLSDLIGIFTGIS